jgi:dephospho-CoA kinase
MLLHAIDIFCKSTGDIDREALGKLVFSDANARRRLNRATHPAVTVELAKQLLCHFLRLQWMVVSVLCPLRLSLPACRICVPADAVLA